MKRKSEHSCQFDALETRTYLSAVHGLHPTIAAEVRRVRVPVAPALVGTIGGSFNQAAQPPVSVSGSVSPLGAVTGSGTLAGTLKPGGSLVTDVTLVNGSSNSVTVRFVAAIPTNLKKAPKITAIIIGASSAFANMVGETGTGTIKLANLAPDFSSGTFTLSIRTAPRRG
jgi:hypothetical protein